MNIQTTLEDRRWTFAKTMPDNPHWYTVRKNWKDQDLFELVVVHIRDFGEDHLWHGQTFRYFFMNGWTYWSMGNRGAPIEGHYIINRCRTEKTSPYDALADSYNAMFEDPKHLAENQEIAGMFAGKDKKLDGRVLDIGCGTGTLLDLVEVGFGDYTGIDPSERMLGVLKARHPIRETVQCKAEHFHSHHRFDHVIGLFGTPSYVHPAMWTRLPGLLAPGGQVFLMFYAEEYQPLTHAALPFPPWIFREEDRRDSYVELAGVTVERWHDFEIWRATV